MQNTNQEAMFKTTVTGWVPSHKRDANNPLFYRGGIPSSRNNTIYIQHGKERYAVYGNRDNRIVKPMSEELAVERPCHFHKLEAERICDYLNFCVRHEKINLDAEDFDGDITNEVEKTRRFHKISTRVRSINY